MAGCCAQLLRGAVTTPGAGVEMVTRDPHGTGTGAGAGAGAGAYIRGAETIGAGAYGKVYKARCAKTGRAVAIKCLVLKDDDDDDDDGVLSSSLREISLLKELGGHPHIVRLLEVQFSATNKVELVFEYMDQDLSVFIRTAPALPVPLVKRLLYQILSGVDACHARGIMHRDLKPQNILVNNAGPHAKLADFGLARAFMVPLRKYTHEIVTLWYRAPEILLGIACYGPPVDMWSVGAIFIELLKRKPAWRGDSEIDQLFKIFQCMGTPDETTWPGVTCLRDYNLAFPHWPAKPIAAVAPGLDAAGLDLLQAMLRYNPDTRISAKQALLHPFFAELHECEAAVAAKSLPALPVTPTPA